MKLFHVILKLILTLGLTNSEDYNQLTVDVKDWEATAVEDSDDKLKSVYAKIHKGVWLRLLTPFLFVFLTRWTKDILNGSKDIDEDFD